MDAATRMQSIIAAAERSRARAGGPERDVAPADGRPLGDALTCDPQDRRRRAQEALQDLVIATSAPRKQR